MTTTDMKTAAALQQIGQHLRVLLEANLTSKWDCLERPFALAHMLLPDKPTLVNAASHDFEAMCGAYAGLMAAAWVQPCLQLHADLTRTGYTTAENHFEFGNDAYVWAAADREFPEEAFPLGSELAGDNTCVLPPRRAKVIALSTQSRSFAIVLNERFGRWHLHFREVWPEFGVALFTGNLPYDLEKMAGRTDLTLKDVLTLVNSAAQFSDEDHAKGGRRTQRPSLRSLLQGNLMAGDEDAGVSLRYGDGRDSGYVLSLENDRDGCPQGKDIHWGGYASVSYVAGNLASAIDALRDEFDTE